MDVGITMAKSLFFDRSAILGQMTKKEARVLKRFGARVRGAARASIRRGRKPSRPGSPPRSVTGLLKKFLFFQFEPQTRNVVIGPAKFAASKPNTPEQLEHGGDRVAARPFMAPAFRRVQPSLREMWAE